MTKQLTIWESVFCSCDQKKLIMSSPWRAEALRIFLHLAPVFVSRSLKYVPAQERFIYDVMIIPFVWRYAGTFYPRSSRRYITGKNNRGKQNTHSYRSWLIAFLHLKSTTVSFFSVLNFPAYYSFLLWVEQQRNITHSVAIILPFLVFSNCVWVGGWAGWLVGGWSEAWEGRGDEGIRKAGERGSKVSTFIPLDAWIRLSFIPSIFVMLFFLYLHRIFFPPFSSLHPSLSSSLSLPSSSSSSSSFSSSNSFLLTSLSSFPTPPISPSSSSPPGPAPRLQTQDDADSKKATRDLQPRSGITQMPYLGPRCSGM